MRRVFRSQSTVDEATPDLDNSSSFYCCNFLPTPTMKKHGHRLQVLAHTLDMPVVHEPAGLPSPSPTEYRAAEMR
jgi:hypothetical protein